MARKVWLFWIPEGLEPLSSFHKAKYDNFRRIAYGSLCEAVQAAVIAQPAEKGSGNLPWIRAGSGKGSAVFNWQAILLLSEICTDRSEKKVR
ncbi:hypothetical protein [Sphingobium sp.]|uniref:hypothetical protein n=1 Tax=Sphingobium TaxID=165695 RepID=UPI00257A1B8D|nr:hypothetical protein [Sphingobium sp.]